MSVFPNNNDHNTDQIIRKITAEISVTLSIYPNLNLSPNCLNATVP